jgi:glycosyltransferase involved in cell wall biosynthesis
VAAPHAAPGRGHGGLRILFLVQKPQRRGAEIFAFQLAAELRRQGCDVRTAYLYPYEGVRPLNLADRDSRLGGVEGHFTEKLVGFHPQLLRRVSRVIRDFRPDIVQANGSRTLKYGALARRLHRGGSWALVYRNIAEPDRWISGWRHGLFYRRMVMPNVDGIVGVSDVTLANVRAMYPMEVPTTRIPRAVDGDALRPTRSRAEVRAATGTGADAPVVVFIGSLAAEKRPDRLLRVFGGIRGQLPDARLWIIGEGPLEAAVAAQVVDDGLDGSVSILGVQEHVADFLGAADVLLLTSDTEGTPGVLLEAGVVGVPVVATRVGGVAGCVRDGETGILADPEDEPALVAAAVSLLQDARARRRFGSAARAWVSENFALDTVSKEYLDFYHEVLSSVRAGR